MYVYVHRDWKRWSADRFTTLWKHFLERPEAKKDPQYKTIKTMYETVLKAASQGVL